MDPYLEGPAWPGFHTLFTADVARQLASRLPTLFVARLYRDEVAGRPASPVRIRLSRVSARRLTTVIGVRPAAGVTLVHQAGVNAVDIALIRGDVPRADYGVSIRRAGRVGPADVWRTSLRDPLPTVPIPLDGDEPDVLLDLQAAFDTLYDTYNYDREIRYVAALARPLSADDAAWAAERIARWKA